VLILLKGEKTSLFWVGLIISSLAFFVLLVNFWNVRFYESWEIGFIIWSGLPVIIAGVYFILIGLVMMKLGIKKVPTPIQKVDNEA
jgi:hypothetical protein